MKHQDEVTAVDCGFTPRLPVTSRLYPLPDEILLNIVRFWKSDRDSQLELAGLAEYAPGRAPLLGPLSAIPLLCSFRALHDILLPLVYHTVNLNHERALTGFFTFPKISSYKHVKVIRCNPEPRDGVSLGERPFETAWEGLMDRMGISQELVKKVCPAPASWRGKMRLHLESTYEEEVWDEIKEAMSGFFHLDLGLKIRKAQWDGKESWFGLALMLPARCLIDGVYWGGRDALPWPVCARFTESRGNFQLYSIQADGRPCEQPIAHVLKAIQAPRSKLKILRVPMSAKFGRPRRGEYHARRLRHFIDAITAEPNGLEAITIRCVFPCHTFCGTEEEGSRWDKVRLQRCKGECDYPRDDYRDYINRKFRERPDDVQGDDPWITQDTMAGWKPFGAHPDDENVWAFEEHYDPKVMKVDHWDEGVA